jgi:hypothetical protein
VKLVALVPFAALTFLAAPSFAQRHVTEDDWRQADRSDHFESGRGSPQRAALEIRFGRYKPAVDDEFSGTGPYARTFGDDARFHFGLELDWQALRIPYFGVLGPAFGWSYFHASAKAKFTGTNIESAEDTSLTIMPMHLSAVLRLDELERRTHIPIVPYAKLGLGLGLWSAANTAGPSTVKVNGQDVAGKDTTWGVHSALGMMFCLNILDERSAARLDEETGVNHSYLFAEWMRAGLSGLGSRPQMNIGTNTWVVGLALDM